MMNQTGWFRMSNRTVTQLRKQSTKTKKKQKKKTYPHTSLINTDTLDKRRKE